MTNKSIKYHSFVYTQFKCQRVLFDSWIRPNQVLPLRTRMDLGAMTMKEYSTFPKLCHYWSLTIKFLSGHSFGGGVLPLCIDTVGVFYDPSRLDWNIMAKLPQSWPRSEFELQSLYYIHFWTNTLGKGRNPFISPVMASREEWLWH